MAKSAQTPASLFQLNAIYPYEESRTLELKEVKGTQPVGAISNMADEYAVGFLNSQGGTILWGIADRDRRIVGVPLDAAAKDNVRRQVAAKLFVIKPEIDPTSWSLEIHPIQGSEPNAPLFIVELKVPRGDPEKLYFTSGTEAFVRGNGVTKKLSGPEISAAILRRQPRPVGTRQNAIDPRTKIVADRVKRAFAAHGVNPAQIPRFLEEVEAPFGITLGDIRTTAEFLSWLSEEKLDWIAKTFLVEREWLDGEEAGIQQKFSFHKQPAYFFETMRAHVNSIPKVGGLDCPHAYFIHNGKKRNELLVVVRIPIARIGNDRHIYRYISDVDPYPANDPFAFFQLRAWTRLLHVVLGMSCAGYEVREADSKRIWNNEVFLHEALESPAFVQRSGWVPEDYALKADESVVAKEAASLPAVLEYLRKNGLPTDPSH